MRKRISAILLVIAMVLTTVLSPMSVQAAVTTVKDYEVTKPVDYDETRQYPVIYVMPQNGYDIDDSGIVAKLQNAMKDGTSTDAIIVRPAFAEGTDLHAAMKNLVTEIDGKYSTLQSADYRAIVGTGVGGYLAYILGLTEKVEAEVTPDEVAPVEATTENEETVPVEGTDPAEGTDVEAEVASEEGVASVGDADPVESADSTESEDPAEDTTPAVAAISEDVEPVAEEETATYQAITSPKLFKYIASTRGDFVSSDNSWYAIYGDVYTYLETMGANALSNFYTYIDAPVDDKWTDMEKSSDDIGALGINQGLGSNSHEFTVRVGSFTDGFLTESANRIADRVSSSMLAGLVDGTQKLSKTTVTSAVKTLDVTYTVNVKDMISTFAPEGTKVEITVSMINPTTGEVVSSAAEVKTVKEAATLTGTMTLDNNGSGNSSSIQLSVKLLNANIVLATSDVTNIQDPVIDGDNQKIDIKGDWYFNYVGAYKSYIVSELNSEEYSTWSVVQPGLAQWANGFGNISQETVGVSPDSWFFEYAITGNGYYVKEFDVPENFDTENPILSIGYVDDRCEVFLNGTRVGATGMDEDGNPTGDTTWAVHSYFEVDPDLINKGGKNVVIVRAWNDTPYGGGGWYNGPIGLYSPSAFEEEMASIESRFVEKTFTSEIIGEEKEYLVYLPEGYGETDRYYPTLYLLHQFNSDHTSYKTDDIDKLIENATGLEDMIVIVPNSSESSGWANEWDQMLTEELIPLIDSKYRTIDDARYRFTAGCSMGGQGAMAVALTNPDYFSGAVSFFGALSYSSMWNAPNVLEIAEKESVEYLDNYALYFICGNQDSYKFGTPAIELHQILDSKDVDHKFFIENGGHFSAFYVPNFIDGLQYARDNMYKSDEAVESLLSGKVTLDTSDGVKVKAEFNALAGIEKYYNLIPASSYTVDQTPDLSIPLIVQVVQDGKVVYSQVERDHKINTGDTSEIFNYDLTNYVDLTKDYTIVYKAAIFDRVVELSSETVKVSTDNGNAGTGSGNVDADDATNTSDSDKASSVDTGDRTPITLYVVIAVAAMAAVVVALRMKRRA